MRKSRLSYVTEYANVIKTTYEAVPTSLGLVRVNSGSNQDGVYAALPALFLSRVLVELTHKYGLLKARDNVPRFPSGLMCRNVSM